MSVRRSETRQKILETADELFSARGIQAVGVDEIAREAGFTKRTLYYHFPSKDELIAGWLEYTSELTSPPSALDTMAPDEAIATMFRGLARKLAGGDYRGCPYILTRAELSDAPPIITAVVSKHKTARREWFVTTLERGGVPPKLAKETAQQLMVLWEGAWASSVVFADGTPIKAAQGMAAAIVKDALS